MGSQLLEMATQVHVISLSWSCICLCVSVFQLVKSCLLITLIKCLKGHDLNRRLKVFSKYNCVIVFVLAFVILQDPGNPGVRPIMGPNVYDLSDATLADEDANSILADAANRTLPSNMTMQVAPLESTGREISDYERCQTNRARDKVTYSAALVDKIMESMGSMGLGLLNVKKVVQVKCVGHTLWSCKLI